MYLTSPYSRYSRYSRLRRPCYTLGRPEPFVWWSCSVWLSKMRSHLPPLSRQNGLRFLEIRIRHDTYLFGFIYSSISIRSGLLTRSKENFRKENESPFPGLICLYRRISWKKISSREKKTRRKFSSCKKKRIFFLEEENFFTRKKILTRK